jgi:hypothetical protein
MLLKRHTNIKMSAVEEHMYGVRAAINWPLTGRIRRGGGIYVDF